MPYQLDTLLRDSVGSHIYTNYFYFTSAVHEFLKSWEPLQNSKPQKGDMKKVPY